MYQDRELEGQLRVHPPYKLLGLRDCDSARDATFEFKSATHRVRYSMHDIASGRVHPTHVCRDLFLGDEYFFDFVESTDPELLQEYGSIERIPADKRPIVQSKYCICDSTPWHLLSPSQKAVKAKGVFNGFNEIVTAQMRNLRTIYKYQGIPVPENAFVDRNVVYE